MNTNIPRYAANIVSKSRKSVIGLISLGLLIAAQAADPNFTPKPGFVKVPVNPSGKFEARADQAPSIQWDNVLIQHDAGKNETFFDFEFTGTAKEDASIAYVRLTCGCQNAQINKTSFKKGEKVTLSVRVSFQPTSGTSRRPLEVFTDKGGPVTLTAVVNSPARMMLSAIELTWPEGDKAPKNLVVKTLEPKVLEDLQVMGKEFTHEIIKESDTITRVVITPTGVNARGAVRVREQGISKPSYVTLSYGGTPPPPSQAQVAPQPQPDTAPNQSSQKSVPDNDRELAIEMLKTAIKLLEKEESK